MHKILLIIISIIFITLLIGYFVIYYYNNKIREDNLKVIEKLEKNNLIEDQDFLNIPKYYINLERSKDRNEKINKQFKKYNIKNYHRIEAFDIKNLDKNNYINEYTHFLDGKSVELAVTLSHIKAINTAYLNGEEYALIMEDDINFCTVPFWKTKLKDLINNLGKDCDLFLLSNSSFITGVIEVLTTDNIFGIANGVCYLVTKKGMEKVNNNFINKETNKIQILKKHKLGEQPFVFDRGFMKFFKVYYTSQSLFIPEDYKQSTLIQNHIFGVQNDTSNKIIKHYKKYIENE